MNGSTGNCRQNLRPHRRRPRNTYHSFFAAAAEAMRRILVEAARRKSGPQHGGNLERVDLDDASLLCEGTADELLAVHEALDLLAAEDAVKAELVKLRCFAGITQKEAAAALEISRATADRYWAYAKAYIYCSIYGPDHVDSA